MVCHSPAVQLWVNEMALPGLNELVHHSQICPSISKTFHSLFWVPVDSHLDKIGTKFPEKPDPNSSSLTSMHIETVSKLGKLASG